MATKLKSKAATATVTNAKDALAAAVARQMPGWKMVGPSKADSAAVAGDDAATAQGADLAALRKKFLGSSVPPRNKLKLRPSSAASTKRTVFKVAPTDGGPSQVAELRGDGKIRIVTG